MNIASGFAAALISTLFEYTLQAVVAVAFFIPLVLTLSETFAMRTVTFSLQKVHLAGGRMQSELKAGVLLGAMSGAVVAMTGYAWLGLIKLAMVVGLSILVAGTVGSLFGYMIPAWSAVCGWTRRSRRAPRSGADRCRSSLLLFRAVGAGSGVKTGPASGG